MKHLSIAIVAMAVLCVIQAGCRHEEKGIHEQVLDRIAQAEEMLDEVDLDSSITILQQAYDFSASKNYQWGMAEACLDIGRCYFMMDNPDSALAMLDKGMKVFPAMPDSMRAEYYADYAADFAVIGEVRKAVTYMRQALPLIKESGDDESYCITCANIGIQYRHMGMNDSAVYFYQQGLDLAVKMGDLESQAMLANNLAVLYGDMGRYEESLNLADKAISNSRSIGDVHEEISDIGTKGDILVLSERYEEAADALLDAYLRSDSVSNPLTIKARLLSPLLKALYHSKRPEHKALYPRYMAQCEQLIPQLNPNSVQGSGLLMTQLTLQVDEKQYNQGLKTLALIEGIHPMQIATSRNKFYSNKAKCLAGLGRYQEAYQALDEAYLAADSIKNKEISDKLSQLTASYEMMQKELEVSRLSQQHERNKTRITILVAILLALLAALGALALWTRQRRQQARMRETRRWVEGVEQERARFARELHDGACNDLLAIGMQLHGDMPDTAQIGQQISTLRATLRNLSHELMPPQFTQGVRLDQALQYYLSHIDSPKVDFRAVGEGWDMISADTAYQVYRITQEAIGNIITHQPEAQVVVSLTPAMLHIVSKGEKRQGDGSGIGLQSMKGRADSIGASIKMTDEGDAFTVQLDFPGKGRNS